MAKKKLIHFAENLTFPHLFQYPYFKESGSFPLRGQWHRDYFRNDHPITLELGCGKGEYTLNLAIRHPDRNFVGIDIKGARLWRGCKMVEELGIGNVAFIRTRIELILHFFTKGEVDEIWLTFPDPHPQRGRVSRRLTSPGFLAKYAEILKPLGVIHLKTDNTGLLDYTLDMIREHSYHLLFSSEDVYKFEEPVAATAIQTFYERKYIKEGIPIKYIAFTLDDKT